MFSKINSGIIVHLKKVNYALMCFYLDLKYSKLQITKKSHSAKLRS